MKLAQKRTAGSHSVPARSWPILCLLPILGCPLIAAADCTFPLNPADSHFSDAVREFYEDVCGESDVRLVLALDPSVKSRLELPSKGHRLIEDDIYPDKARKLSFEGSVVVAFVVETDGTIQHAKIMASSGHRVLDYAEWMYWKQYKFDSPGRFDGTAARVLIVERMNFKLKGRGVGLPASFSDRAVDGLGYRILQPYTRGDAAALYQDLDETAKSTTSTDEIQKRFALYAKQFGAMSYVAYEGLLGVKNVAGVPHYELTYLVRSAVPKGGAAIMIVTAVDRQPRPGITRFEFKESNIRLNF